MSEASRRAAEAVHRRARRVVLDQDRPVERAVIRTLHPLTCELFESAITLKYLDDWRMSDEMRWYRRNYGLHVGDELMLVEMHDHEWLAVGHFGGDDVPPVLPSQVGIPSLVPVLTPANMLAWWRLGESTGWVPDAAGFWGSDSSPNGHALNARWDAGLDPIDWLTPSDHIPGAVPSDDGAIRFNNSFWPWTGPFSLNVFALEAHGFSVGEFPDTGGFTLSAWVKYIPPAEVIGTQTWGFYTAFDRGPMPIISTYYRGFGGVPPAGGWALNLDPGYGYLEWAPLGVSWYRTPFGLNPDQWYHVAITLEKLATNSYKRRFLLDLSELHSQTGTAAELGVADGSGGVAGLTLGGGWTDDIRFSLQACGLDEVALWNAPLTDVEIAAARAGSMPGMTDEWSTVVIGAGGSTNPFAVQSGLVPDGYVLASDGAGGTTYIRSGGTFYHNGA